TGKAVVSWSSGIDVIAAMLRYPAVPRRRKNSTFNLLLRLIFAIDHLSQLAGGAASELRVKPRNCATRNQIDSRMTTLTIGMFPRSLAEADSAEDQDLIIPKPPRARHPSTSASTQV